MKIRVLVEPLNRWSRINCVMLQWSNHHEVWTVENFTQIISTPTLTEETRVLDTVCSKSMHKSVTCVPILQSHVPAFPYIFPLKRQMIPTWQLSGLSVKALTASAGRGWAGLCRANQRGSGGCKSPKQELMSIIVLGKNKSHLKSLRIPKQLQ